MKVLVTGASGFIGGRLIGRLTAAACKPRALVRGSLSLPGVECVSAALEDAEGLQRACRGMDAIVHCAGHAHAFGEGDGQSGDLHRKINYEATARLAELAAREGVSRFVFLSSVKAAGHDGKAVYDELCQIPPVGAYGESKRMAETALQECGRRTGMGTVVLRLAMTYGRGGRGNLERMAAAIRAGWFPPLPRTAAPRSVLHVDDAVSATLVALVHERAPGRSFIVADPVAYSARQLQDAIRHALGLSELGRGMPAGLLRLAGALGDGAGRLAGLCLPLRSEVVGRLLDAECYSSDRIRAELGWQARMGLRDGIAEMLGQGGVQA
ncbi:NAD-dependent epimerase/dehydratase family protein [Thauera sp. CAU 1555]|uniref:NAD-dependent epimerase/dehydratase family protein n=1 Tax=Thauera sedimentorum TaxID=2767595 RepID=A0ABR9B7Z8_9RHOO|nr:NAD-dependent epimerase/dehydratase family protein [Thauera sedimentorum]MBC9070371.1 NAD-dependent epimerase/dehydratase family protein [Thauera sedimentorum]MBD8501291.1 NAD-dependent epimerase/dehydratase family protein [Thauera sedimentorum]